MPEIPLPSPGTAFLRLWWRGQRVQPRTSAAIVSRLSEGVTSREVYGRLGCPDRGIRDPDRAAIRLLVRGRARHRAGGREAGPACALGLRPPLSRSHRDRDELPRALVAP